MKKQISRLILALGVVAVAASCSKSADEPVTDGRTQLVLSVDGADSRATTNYSADKYLTLAGYGEVDVTVLMVSATYAYENTTMDLKATATPFYFPIDGSALTFKAEWPTAAKRDAIGATLPKDQSTALAFLTSDFLSVTVKAYASTKVPVNFEHEHSKATFSLEGTSFYGKRITKLVFNGYTAYCAADCNDAQLIFKPLAGQNVFTAGSNGAFQVEGDPAMYTFTLAEAVTGFDKGSHHTIKLNVNE